MKRDGWQRFREGSRPKPTHPWKKRAREEIDQALSGRPVESIPCVICGSPVPMDLGIAVVPEFCTTCRIRERRGRGLPGTKRMKDDHGAWVRLDPPHTVPSEPAE